MRIIIFSHIQPKILQKSHVSTIFCPIFTYIFNASTFPRVRLLYDVTVTSYEVQWYLFWYQWIEEVHTYTLVANIGVSGVQYRKSWEGVATPPPSEDVLQKIPQQDEGYFNSEYS